METVSSLKYRTLPKIKGNFKKYLLLNCISDVSEVVWSKVKERLDFQTRHLLQDESIICFNIRQRQQGYIQ